MKYLLTLPLLAALMLPSCATVSNVRADLNTMDVAQYENLRHKVSVITEITSSRLAKDWDAEKRAKAISVISQGRELLQGNNLAELGATDLIRGLAERYGEKLGLDEQARRDIKDAALLVDAAVGPIKLGIDGKLTEREKGLIIALLDGLERGLS